MGESSALSFCTMVIARTLYAVQAKPPRTCALLTWEPAAGDTLAAALGVAFVHRIPVREGESRATNPSIIRAEFSSHVFFRDGQPHITRATITSTASPLEDERTDVAPGGDAFREALEAAVLRGDFRPLPCELSVAQLPPDRDWTEWHITVSK